VKKTTKLDTLEKLFQAMRSETMLTRLSDNLPKKLSRWIMKTRHSKYSFALSVHKEVRTKP